MILIDYKIIVAVKIFTDFKLYIYIYIDYETNVGLAI